ncbi:acylneuraminate cytidylyltransferase family protein [bacterium]|nr:MAG: acylneuraminate cytidylyltransferase family protein [bacterium]
MILGVIPARGGSKGIPRKNIKPLLGKPLIAWTLEAARAARRLDRFVVSTEDAEIAAVARGLGAEVLMRPPELARDETSTLAVLEHAVRSLSAEAVVVLQPTSPVRDPGLIDLCIERFLDSGADSLATGFTCKFQEYGTHSARRQDIPGFFYDDGNVYVIKGSLILQGDRYGRRIERVLLDKEQNLDIDDPFDFSVAEFVLKKRVEEGRQRP